MRSAGRKPAVDRACRRQSPLHPQKRHPGAAHDGRHLGGDDSCRRKRPPPLHLAPHGPRPHKRPRRAGDRDGSPARIVPPGRRDDPPVLGRTS